MIASFFQAPARLGALVGLAAAGLFVGSTIPARAVTVSTDAWWEIIGRDLHITDATFTSVGSGVFSSNSATVTPGSTLDLSFNWDFAGASSDFSDCPFCVIQQYVAWIQPSQTVNSSAGFISGVFPSTNYKTSGSFAWETTAPSTPGEYYIGMGSTLDYYFYSNVPGVFGGPSDSGPYGDVAAFMVTVQQSPITPDPVVVIEDPASGPNPLPSLGDPAAAPGPLPLFGAAAAFGYSRKLRQRVRAASKFGGSTSSLS